MSPTNYPKVDEPCSKSQFGPRTQPEDLINRLPDDCICDIFRLLDAPNDLGSCATVSWRWAELVLSLASKLLETQQTSHVVLEGHGLDDTQLVIKVIGIPCGDMVSALDIIQWSSGADATSGVGHVTDKGVRFASIAFPDLFSVRLIGCPMITDEGILEISTRCSTSFSSLHIEDCPSITFASLQTLVKHAKRLSFLSLDSCPQIPGSAIVSFMIQKPGLADLRLQSMDVENTIFLPVEPMEPQEIHCLRTLLLEDCSDGYLQGLLPQMFAHFELPLLKCLMIRGCTVNHLDLLRLLGPNTMLEILDLESVRFSSYAGLMEVLYSCQETIQELTLDKITMEDVSPPGAAGDDIVPQGCPQMWMIRLNDCEDIVDIMVSEFLPWLAMACPELMELGHLRMGITPNLLDVMCRCKMITKMDLTRCDGNDADADCVISLLGGTLEELVLDGWTQFTGHLEKPLGRRCRRLTRLSLCHTAVDDSAMWFMMSEKSRYLEELVLAGTWVTSEVLYLLFRPRLPRLRILDLRDCQCVTSAVVYKLSGWSDF